MPVGVGRAPSVHLTFTSGSKDPSPLQRSAPDTDFFSCSIPKGDEQSRGGTKQSRDGNSRK